MSAPPVPQPPSPAPEAEYQDSPAVQAFMRDWGRFLPILIFTVVMSALALLDRFVLSGR
jgi:hypothetical protein